MRDQRTLIQARESGKPCHVKLQLLLEHSVIIALQMFDEYPVRLS
jgi:hypothetical protein